MGTQLLMINRQEMIAMTTTANLRLYPLVTLTVLGLCPAASAAVTAINPTSTTATLPLARSATVKLNWEVTTNLATSVTVRSNYGRFLTPSGIELGRISTDLSRTITGTAPKSVDIAETVRIPSAITVKAKKLGSNTLHYERRFDDGSGNLSAYIGLQTTTAKAATLSLVRVALSFDNGRQLRLIARGEALQAQAHLAINGSGLIQGAWEIAGPESSAGEPTYIMLKKISRHSGGENNLIVVSPPLPTQTEGTHLLRLRLTRPQVNQDLNPDALLLRYVVNPEEL